MINKVQKPSRRKPPRGRRWLICISSLLAEHAKIRSRRSLALLLVAFCPYFYLPASAQSTVVNADTYSFAKFDVVIDSVARQTVLTGFLSDAEYAELIILNYSNQGKPSLTVYSMSAGHWQLSSRVVLERKVAFADVVRVGRKDRLVVYESEGLFWLDQFSGSLTRLALVNSTFVPPRQDEIPHVDISHDINSDGRDDLVVPAEDGFNIFVQDKNGGFSTPILVGSAPQLERISGADGYRYDPWSISRVFQIDYNRDGLSDLVYWNAEEFVAHLQEHNGLIAEKGISFKTNVFFNSDDQSYFSDGSVTGSVLNLLADLNSDGIADLVVHTLEGTEIANKLSKIQIHYGMNTPADGTIFNAEVGANFVSPGNIFIECAASDFDGDGNTDLVLTTVAKDHLEGSLWKMLKGMMGDDVWLDLEFYRSEDGLFSSKPDHIRRIALDGAPSHREPGWVPIEIVMLGGLHQQKRTRKKWPRAFNPNLFIGDVTGDGRTDLLIENSFRDLQLHLGVPGQSLFTENSQDVRIISPPDKEYAWLVDMNQDGKMDILMHHPFIERDIHGGTKQPPGTEMQQIAILISQ